MSLNNPAFPQETSRPGTSWQRHRYGDEVSDAAQPESITSPTYDGAVDEVMNTTENDDDGAKQQPAHVFQPFFTLIEDAHTSDCHHPIVHYIFSDDDTDIVTEAALRSLEAQQEQGAKKNQAINPSDDVNSPPEHEKSTLLPPPIPGVRENYIVLDIEPTPTTQDNPNSTPGNASGVGPGATTSASTSPPPANQPHTQIQVRPGTNVLPSQYRVTGAKSFSPTWQVLRSELVAAPTFENQDPGVSPGHGLMLKIHGTGGLSADIGREKERDRGSQRLEEMMDQFAKRMRELQTVIDTADVGAGEHVESREGTGPEKDGEGEEPEPGIPDG
ncbi:hypothetical protein N7492_004134 [Penicillium capsulatum]|uniref:Anaphase promoting complex subunit 11 n=1 Tax=Penicillium capsulatum TaxID=69766 RepID=A0A9W9LXK7_9EURO|nr:hypothetical protein N7492_004134 [Penicillium capsulatum]KAJ6121296.1 hypothetical protein N7512_003761 [Penicillium capsulatum]